MSKWAWLSTSLKEKPGVFGEFSQCLTFHSRVQSITPSSVNPTNSCPSPSNSKTLSSENDVHTYLDNLDKTQPDVCVFAFTNPTPENNGKLPLPISKRLLERITQDFNLSSTFLNVLDTGLATYTSTIPSKSRKDGKEWESAQFVIQQNRAYSAFSIALTFNIGTGRSRAILFGAETKVVSELFQYLSSMSPQPYGPMVIPTVAMELQAQSFSTTIKNCHDRVYSIEVATGMRQFNFPHEKKGVSPQDWKTLDLISITRDLSSFLSRFAFLKLQAETGANLVEQMARTTELLIEKTHKKDARGFITDDQYNIISKLDEIRNLYLGMAARCRYLTERTAAQSQTVHCLIASQYNLTNIDIARESRNIAELARRDNKLTFQVAKDSRAVAIAAARDSAAMQVIAAVTVLFLPATFTATFFSMSFFDFPGAERPRVSVWIWIYVLVTAILTIVIQLSWASVSNRKKEQITRGIQ
ncbi:hypothetical protein GGR54DRAFT_599839 [Hypoxylon sp. NC1633]|nr:hypothetical protein GGR54DRAFT_599839 [Hypoxylon sp. NC1633]